MHDVIKCVVVGDSTVGKTSFLMTFVQNQFPKQVPTIYETHKVAIESQGRDYLVSLWDTGVDKDYDQFRPLSYTQTDVFLLCFSLVDRPSLDHLIHKWYVEVKHHAPTTPLLLVGTKMDLRDELPMVVSAEKSSSEKEEASSRRSDFITHDEGLKVAKELGAYGYIECSSKRRENLNEILEKIVEAFIRPMKNQRCRYFKCHLM